MHDELVAFLLNGLDCDEAEDVQSSLTLSTDLIGYLETLRLGIEPLKAAEYVFEVPAGLAIRTCRYVLASAVFVQPPGPPDPQ
jgi:hypothetical protein